MATTTTTNSSKSDIVFDPIGLTDWMTRLYENDLSGPMHELLDNARDAIKDILNDQRSGDNTNIATNAHHQCRINYNTSIVELYKPSVERLSVTNPAKNIKDINHILTFAKSSKKGEEGATGENGVGLIQSCSLLAECALIITCENEVVQVGILPPGELKTRYTKTFPTNSISSVNIDEMQSVLNPYGVNITNEIANLKHFNGIFHLILIGTGKKLVKRGKNLKDVKNAIVKSLPKLYLQNVPMKWYIDDELITPVRWEQKLAELCRIKLEKPKTIDVYFGFNPGIEGAEMLLFSYGRLIMTKEDPRACLKVPAQGSTFLAGMTVLIDDRGVGDDRYFVPRPTKEGIVGLDEKLKDLEDLGHFYKVYYKHWFNPFKVWENPTKTFRNAVKNSEINYPVFNRSRSINSADIKHLKLGTIEVVKHIWKRDTAHYKKGSIRNFVKKSYRRGVDSARHIRIPKPGEGNKKAKKKRKIIHQQEEEEEEEEEEDTSSDSDSSSSSDSDSSGSNDANDVTDMGGGAIINASSRPHMLSQRGGGSSSSNNNSNSNYQFQVAQLKKLKNENTQLKKQLAECKRNVHLITKESKELKTNARNSHLETEKLKKNYRLQELEIMQLKKKLQVALRSNKSSSGSSSSGSGSSNKEEMAAKYLELKRKYEELHYENENLEEERDVWKKQWQVVRLENKKLKMGQELKIRVKNQI